MLNNYFLTLQKSLLSFTLCVSSLLLFQECEATTESIPKPEASAFLTEFYTKYINECDSPLPNSKPIIEIRKKYITTILLKKLEEQSFDFDPYLNSQDCNSKWLNSMNINSTDSTNTFEVSFTNSFQNQRIKITLELVKESGRIKISNLK